MNVPGESLATAQKLLQPETVLAEFYEANMAIKVLTLIRPTPTSNHHVRLFPRLKIQPETECAITSQVTHFGHSGSWR